MKYHFLINIWTAICLACPSWLRAEVSLPEIFTDNMVLQQRSDVKIWGWATPLEKVTVTTSWDGASREVVADNQANWALTVPTPAAGGPYEMKITGHNQLTISNILIGEVWLCAGQSNMEWTAQSGIEGAEAAMSAANWPDIRLIKIKHRTAASPQIDLATRGWSVCTPETMGRHSAVAYFFARQLQQKMGVPIGIIDDSWGGTPAEAWVEAATVASSPLLSEAAKKLRNEPWGPPIPGRIYHAMVAPITPFRIAGALWYQGETNTANPATYTELLSALIGQWRSAWGYDFPFFFVQIAPYKYETPAVGAMVRDAQRRALAVPKTGMVVTSDIGDVNDIHPRNKHDVGIRLANLALQRHYQLPIGEVSGPLFQRSEVVNGAIRIHFDHAEGLVDRDGKVDGFELAGQDGQYVPAVATIEGKTVLLRSPGVPKPVFARFAWDNTATPDLFNQAGLPASCFQTEKP